MAKGNKSQSQQHPPKRNPALKALDALVGEWEMTNSLFPEHGRVTFEWLGGGAFLAEKMGNDAIWLIGRDESLEIYHVLYFDSRGVSRVYEMSLEKDTWKIWRNSPGFSQRFTGKFSKDGHTITAKWEKSSDGSTWEHDFDLIYTRIE
jgi:hypothetical protein